MTAILKNRTYRHLFLAQVVALLGTGLSTVALGLLAYDLAGENASLVLGLVFTIKMVAYVGIAPIAGAFANRVPRRALLVTLDATRAFVALSLPFVTDVWQIFVLIFLLQSASAAFTPTFQATIPDVLTEKSDYSRALSLSQLAYNLENIFSPTLAALILAVLSYEVLFLGTMVGFVASALLVLTVLLPSPQQTERRGIHEQTTRGMRIFFATPRLRGLLALNLAVSTAGAMVLVNSVVLIRSSLGLGESDLAMTMAVFGIGSMTAALILPRLLDKFPDRPIMLSGAGLMGTCLIGLATAIYVIELTWPLLLACWFMVGLGYASILTPSGHLLTRSAHPEDRPAVFAAQFALSHACWLLTYPVAGILLTFLGVIPTLIALGGVALANAGLASLLWPTMDTDPVPHTHSNLPDDHPHIRHAGPHRHTLIIDELHPRWPAQAQG